MGCALLALAQTSERHTLSGYVTDAASGETLIGATVWAEAVSQGVASNVYGFYTLTLPVDVYEVRVSYLGYTPQRFEVDLSAKDLKLNLELQPGLALKEAVVTGEKENRIEEQVQMSKMEIPIEQIKALPAIGGEVDLLKSLQLLPGVQSGGEGTSGLYVRGGSPDQNLHAPRWRAAVQCEPPVWVFQRVQRGCGEEHDHHQGRIPGALRGVAFLRSLRST